MPELILKVAKKWLETPTIAAVRLGLNGNEFRFKAGQCSLVHVRINGEWVDHTFSMACAPGLGYLEFATRLSDSPFKKTFASLQPGDEVKVMGPTGSFTLEPTAHSVCFLSGGIGITPIRSMIQYACREKLPVKISLLFGNHNPTEIPFKQELDELERENNNLRVVHCISEPDAGWTGLTGRINADIIQKNSDALKDLYYICGPPGMVDALTETLKQLNVPDERVRIEHFVGYK